MCMCSRVTEKIGTHLDARDGMREREEINVTYLAESGVVSRRALACIDLAD